MKEILRKQRTAVFRLLLIGAGGVAAVSCGDDQIAGPTDGALLVGARTTGSDFDVNGYLISVNSSQGQEIGNLDTIYVTALEPGDYVVNLSGMAENCSVPADDNPQTATVAAGDTTEVLFDITCEPAPPPGGGGGDLLRTRPGR
jgi:hypothetical protein